MAPPRKDRVQPTRPILSTRPEANKPKRKDIQLNKAIKQPQTFDEDYSATADYDGSKSSKQQKQKHSPTISTKKIPVKDVTPRKPQHAVIDDDNEDGDEVTYGVLYRRNRPFRLFLQSYIANHLGEWLTYLASISAIEQIQAAKGEQSTQLAISLLIVIRLTPNVLLCPFGGVLADGWDRRKSMIILDLIGALVSLLFVLAFNCRSIPLIYLSTFLQECVAGLYEPSRSAIIPLLAEDEEELKKATTMAGMAYSVMAAVGSAAGGLLVSLLGIRGCYVIDSATYLLSAVLMTRMGGKWNVAESKTFETPLGRIRGMIGDGLYYLRTSFFGALAFLKATVSLIGGACDVLNVSLSEVGNPDLWSTRLGMMFASVGVGCILGPIISDHYADMEDPKAIQRFCLHGLAILAIGCFLQGLLDSFELVCVASAIRSIGYAVVWINSSLLLNKFSTPDMLGRITSIEYAAALFCEGLSAVGAGLLEDNLHLGAKAVSLWLGVFGALLWAVWAYYHYQGHGAAAYRGDALKESRSDDSTASVETPDTEASALLNHAHIPDDSYGVDS